MLPDLVRAAATGRGVFADLQLAYRKRVAGARATLCADGRLVVEPWPTVEGRGLEVMAPDARRSGKPTKGREGAIPLFDRADYTFALFDPNDGAGALERAALLNGGYLRLLGDAARDLGDADLARLHTVLSDPTAVAAALAAAKPLFGDKKPFTPDSVVALHDETGPLFGRPAFVRWWQRYVANASVGDGDVRQQCSICGTPDSVVVRKIPNEVFLNGQKCQVSSFKPTAFQSYGKKQTLRASICAHCAALLPSALQTLLKDRSHSALVYRHAPRGRKPDAMKCVTAVWWIERPEGLPALEPAVGGDGVIDWEAALAAFEVDLSLAAGLDEDPGKDGEAVVPLPHVDQARALFEKLRGGGDGQRAVLMDRTAFHVGLLAANTGRLIVRDHMRLDIARLLTNARTFLLAAQGYRFDEATRRVVRKPFGAASLARALHGNSAEAPLLLRGLLRTALLGEPPPMALLGTALPKLTKLLVTGAHDDRLTDATTAALLLYLHYTDDRYSPMTGEITDAMAARNPSAAFQSGRVAAILDAIQRASDPRVPKTAVEKTIMALAASPAGAMSNVLKRGMTVYLPKLRSQRSAAFCERYATLLDEAITAVESCGGFPPRLVGASQAEFLTGYCVQRGLMRQTVAELTKRGAKAAPGQPAETAPSDTPRAAGEAVSAA